MLNRHKKPCFYRFCKEKNIKDCLPVFTAKKVSAQRNLNYLSILKNDFKRQLKQFVLYSNKQHNVNKYFT